MRKAFNRLLQASALLVIGLLVGANVAAAQVSLSVNDISGRPGETATVAVELSGVEGGTAIQSYNFTVGTANGNVVLTGYSDAAGTLDGDADFVTNWNPGTGTIGAFAQGTNITTSGTLVYLTFTFLATGTDTITLNGFTLNAGNPAIVGDFQSAVVIANRFIVASTHTQRVGDTFTIDITAEDAFIAGDNAISFNFVLNYDPTVVSLGTVSTGALNPGWTINSSGAAGTLNVGAFFDGNALVGTGTIATIQATALTVGYSDLMLSGVTINAGVPMYGDQDGSVTVVPNSAPTADSKPATVVEDGSVAITLSGSDADGDPLTFSIVTQPSHGSVSLAGAVATYTPTANYHGADSFTYRANDGYVNSASATVSITVTPVNDDPVWTAQMGDMTVLEDDGVIAFAYGATDVDGDALTFAKVQGPAGATVSSAGAFSWNPMGYPGVWPVQVSVTDGTVTLTSTVATITVFPVDGLGGVLAGVHEMPPVESPASGVSMLRLVADQDLLEVYVSAVDLSAPFTAAHIHLGPVGENGGVVVPLTSTTVSADGRNVTINQSVNLAAVSYPAGVTKASFVDALRSGGAYVNVHTSGNPAGEIRGQVLQATNRAPASTETRGPASVTIAGNPADRLFSVSWLPANDPDGDTVNYIYQMSLNASFTDIVAAERFGTGNGYRLTVAEAAELFDAVTNSAPGNINVGGSITLFHRVITSDGSLWTVGPSSSVTLTRGTVTSNDGLDLPTEFALKGNYPNPFNPTTTIQFDLPQTSEVSVTVLDLLGRVVMAVPATTMDAGASRNVQLDASSLTSGIYLYRVVARAQDVTHTQVGTMTLVK